MTAGFAEGRIDVHHHILPPAYVRRLGARIGAQGLSGATPAWSAEVSLEAMDRNGIGLALTSVSSPGFWFGDTAESADLARASNEFAAALSKDHPRRFASFAGLPLPSIEASLDEIAYAFDRLGACGVTLMTNYSGKTLGDAAFAPVFDELNRRNAVVFIHPTLAGYGHYMDSIPPPTLEFPFETTRAITSLIFSGTLSRCTNIRFIVPHAGGAAPFLAHRIGRLTRIPAFQDKAPHGVLHELRRLYYDTALSANPVAFASLLQVADPARILFGSDYPHAGEPTLRETVQGLHGLGLETRMLGAIESKSARQLLASVPSSPKP